MKRAGTGERLDNYYIMILLFPYMIFTAVIVK